jgi:hypothetical protein
MGNIDRRKRGLRAWRDLREDIGILCRSVEEGGSAVPFTAPLVASGSRTGQSVSTTSILCAGQVVILRRSLLKRRGHS